MMCFDVTSKVDREKNHFIEISGRLLRSTGDLKKTVSFPWTHSPAMLANSIDKALETLMADIMKE